MKSGTRPVIGWRERVGLPSLEIGKTVAQKGRRAMDVPNLDIDRNGVVVPNPKRSRRIVAGDRRLCHGKMLTLRNLVASNQSKGRGRRPKRRDGAEGVGSPIDPRNGPGA